jgi:diguanylate cyclase (GGDEF)-like protein/PAS domain S-box-containing protein
VFYYMSLKYSIVKGVVKIIRFIFVIIFQKIKALWMSIVISQIRLRNLFENSIDGIYRSTLDGQYLEINKALVNILGYDSKKELLKINTRNLYFSLKDRPDFNRRNKIFGTCLKKKDGSKIYVEISPRVIYENGKPKYFEGIVRDKTKEKEYVDKIRHLSFHDALTGLYNWAYFNEKIKIIQKTEDLIITFIIADVDGLKYVNDTYGHSCGDLLLKETANILKDNFRDGDMIARTGGDEFCIILPGTSREEAEGIIRRIDRKCLLKSTEKLPISISFGIAVKKTANVSTKDILREAEKAMYEKKFIKKLYLSAKRQEINK